MKPHKILLFILTWLNIQNLWADNKIQEKVFLNYGGQMNVTFGRVAGPRSGGGLISGYSWLSSYHKLDDDYFISGNAGVSLEKSASSNVIINDTNIGFHAPKGQVFIGRSLNAAGRLHHDLSDFGAPGGGADNEPISFFFDGNFTTNVAQQITQPFSNHVALYVKPYKEFMAIGFSYAPSIDNDHPENYQFFAEAPVKDEISFAVNNEIQIKNFFIGATAGYVQAYRPINNFRVNGYIKSRQFSFHVTEKLKKNNYYNIYEFNSGCLEDRIDKDCRTAFQISKVKDNYTSNYGALYRYDKNNTPSSLTSDYFIGWQWQFAPNVKAGFETIYRIQEEQNTTQTDFHWLTGVQYQF